MVKQRSALDSIPAYKQGAMPSTSDVVKLSSNENPFPPLASVRAAVAEELERIHLYPSMAAPELTSRVATLQGVEPENIVFGAGSVEVATQLVQASAGQGDEVMFAWRSFEAYPIIAIGAGATPVQVPLTADERHDLDAMVDAITDRTAIIFVCNPNNPTGATLTHAEVRAFITRVPSDVLVVIDEAYEHFNRDAETAIGIDLYREFPNVAVLHTFSKAYGLAGLRIGYAVAQADVAANLRKVSVPFAVSALAQTAALASLDAEAELGERIDDIVSERARVTEELRAQGWNVGESQANFVWLRLGDDTELIDAALTRSGVLARAFPGEGIRITIGSPEANRRALAALAGVRQEATR
ncbi:MULTISPECIES: histidinol-phosphate transaminase [unclassified Pseudoclavibacter]|uniref:histidinol-phosphate transaminase n=1 Tax=unclassified Pseudoclavibacter TaxID=2615177 RepID=UPI000CE7B49B|nr:MULTISPECIES: histidinol-phosphate transaminase [unclassified Pseudoclavibacter]MBF4549725.1 histidinol-phosphate transaminase [Pseudoclavibacter sp. VKM Ac-2888]PPF39774.1 histidinol-phosphate transaminase [Pseudoclavibacter sp. AY1H1]